MEKLFVIIIIIASCVVANDYIVKSGDSLWKVSQTYHTTVNDLRAMNPQLKGDTIKVGQQLTVPGLDLAKLYRAFAYVESRGNCQAVGDNGKAVGPVQLWPIMVDEVNRIAGTSYTYDDRTSWEKSWEMFWYIMRHRNVQTVADAVRVWNPRYQGTAYQNAYERELATP